MPSEIASDSLYRRLQQHLDRMPVGFPATKSGIEVRILQRLFTPEEAEIALELSAIPEPARVIHKRLKSKMTLPELEKALSAMKEKGLIMRIPGVDPPLYAKSVFVVGIYERQLKYLTADLERDALQYMEEAFGRAFHTKKTTQLRTVPVNQTIPIERNVATSESIRAYVESSPGPFAVQTCICRRGKDLVGDPCKQTSARENCLTFGIAATEMVNYGVARFISREEMLSLLDAADKEGLVLQPENTQRPLFVCCCCGCCCGVLTSAKRLPEPAEYFSANFYAEINQDTCESCGTCETRCQMDAIEVNEKRKVDRSRCIGCGLCVTTCPSGSITLLAKERQKVPPNDTRALYMKILQERYGPWGVAKIVGQKLLGMKV